MSILGQKLKIATRTKFNMSEEDDRKGMFSARAINYNRKFKRSGGIQVGIRPSAFKRSIDHYDGVFPICFMHDDLSIIGQARVSERATFLNVDEARILRDIPEGQKAWILMEEKIVNALSIGFTAYKENYEDGTYWTTEGRLYELTLCPAQFAVDEGALIKSLFTVVSFQDLPLTDPNTDWDAGRARTRIKEWAQKEDGEVDWKKYSKAFLWYDQDNAETTAGYKLAIADVIEGGLKAVPKAIYAAAAAVNNPDTYRGKGLDIPDEDIPKLKSHLEKYYSKLDKSPPWEKQVQAVGEEALRITGYGDAELSDLWLADPENLHSAQELTRLMKEQTEQFRRWKNAR
jgi:phage head maturation protease